MSFESDRNPSPPPEILNNEELLPDRIGDTVYSKRWIIKTLMNIIEVCDKPIGTPTKANQDGDKLNEVGEGKLDIVELDSNIEEDACTLWDMSASEQVAQFLFDSGVCDIFQDVIHKTKSPRLLEIIVGILGNMCTFDPLCQSIMEHGNLVHTIVFLSGTTDTPSLLQVFRLITAGLKNKNVERLWFEVFKDNMFFMDNIKDILFNSLSSPVILATYHLLYTILSNDYHYAEFWGQDPFLQSVLTAGQLLFKLEVCLDSFFCVFNALCQYTPNVEKFAEKWEEMKPLFFEYANSLGKEECLFDTERVTAVSCYFDSYNTLLNSEILERDSVITGIDYLHSVARVSGAIHNLISNIKKNNPNFQHSEVEDSENLLRRVENRNGSQFITMMDGQEFETWNLLEEIISDTMKTLKKFTEKEDEKAILENILNRSINQENLGILLV